MCVLETGEVGGPEVHRDQKLHAVEATSYDINPRSDRVPDAGPWEGYSILERPRISSSKGGLGRKGGSASLQKGAGNWATWEEPRPGSRMGGSEGTIGPAQRKLLRFADDYGEGKRQGWQSSGDGREHMRKIYGKAQKSRLSNDIYGIRKPGATKPGLRWTHHGSR